MRADPVGPVPLALSKEAQQHLVNLVKDLPKPTEAMNDLMSLPELTRDGHRSDNFIDAGA